MFFSTLTPTHIHTLFTSPPPPPQPHIFRRFFDSPHASSAYQHHQPSRTHPYIHTAAFRVPHSARSDNHFAHQRQPFRRQPRRRAVAVAERRAVHRYHHGTNVQYDDCVHHHSFNHQFSIARSRRAEERNVISGRNGRQQPQHGDTNDGHVPGARQHCRHQVL